MNHFMIDIETLGNSPCSVIKSIGVVQFDQERLGDTLELAVDVDSCLTHGLRVDGSTIAWWMGQSEPARSVFDKPGIKLPEAMYGLTAFLKSHTSDPIMWCNGANFDLPILDSAYRACDLSPGWSYYNTRDYRTMKSLVPYSIFKTLQVQPKVAHSALADAEAQALTLQNIMAWLNKEHPSLKIAA